MTTVPPNLQVLFVEGDADWHGRDGLRQTWVVKPADESEPVGPKGGTEWI
jgi:hypothetical protein